MTVYIIKRVLLAIPVLFVTAFLVFGALHLSPGDPVDMIVGPIAPEHIRERVRNELGLDKPLPVQFVLYLKNVLRGDLGQSILSKRPVGDMIKDKLPVTAKLGLAAFVLAYTLALPLGILAALKRNTFLDWASMAVALIGVSLPGFWLGLLLICSGER